MNLLNENFLRVIGGQGLQKRGVLTSLSAANERLIKEAKEFVPTKTYDVFISHRTLDAKVVYGVKELIERQNLTAFVYWIDNPDALTNPVTKDTADNLRSKMRACRSLLYVDSMEAQHSKWMPWELGYVDGFRQKVAIVPVAKDGESTSVYKGQEYLGLYPWVRLSSAHNRESILVLVDGETYKADLKDWISSTS